MKKIIIVISLLIIIAISAFVIYSRNNNQTGKFYLENEYYGIGEIIDIDASKLKKENYLLFIYNNFCAFRIPCDSIFESFTKESNITILSMPFDEFKETELYRTVKYAPSVLVIKKGKIVAYLDAEKDEDVPRYQDVSEFTSWVSNYIYLSK